MQMTDKLLTEVILLIFMVRDTTLWEWALPFCCRVQALLVYMISILCRPYQNYPAYLTVERFTNSITLLNNRIRARTGRFGGG